jgi:hypothetical protein
MPSNRHRTGSKLKDENMDRRKFIAAAGCAAAIASSSQAFARFMGGAFLDHAVPGVGLTVSGPVRELRLYFNLGVIAAFSSVRS